MVLQLRQAQRHVTQLRDGRLMVAAMIPLTAAGCFADETFVVPPVADEGHVAAMIAACDERRIRVVVPLVDQDVERLAPARDAFAAIGTTVVAPPAELVRLSRDKLAFEQFVGEVGLPVIRSYAPADIDSGCYPLFYKRRFGFGSMGTGICRTPEEREQLTRADSSLLFQPFVSAPEYSVDAFVSRSGRCVVCVPRLRAKVVGGEAHQSRTVDAPGVHAVALRCLEALASRGFSGPANVQVFGTDPPVVIEANLRLGSASVLGNVATDGRLFQAMLREAVGDTVDGNPSDYRVGVQLDRYLGDLFSTEGRVEQILPPPDGR